MKVVEINKLIQELPFEEKVQIIKDYQAKIFGAQESIVALNDITD